MSRVSIQGYKKLNRWGDWESMRPGVDGTVGDTLGSVRYKHDTPDSPLRWDPLFSGANSVRLGSNVQNGDQPGFYGFIGGAKTVDGEFINNDLWGPRGGNQIDVIPTDVYRNEWVVGVPRYTWNSNVARVHKAIVPGDKFMPLPGPYELPPGQLPRGPAPATEIIGAETDQDLLRSLINTLTPQNPQTSLNQLGPMGNKNERSVGMMGYGGRY